MNAEIIAVGSEMLTPDHLDTNSLFVTQKLNENGFEVHLKTIVGDDKDGIANVLRSALRRSALVIVSGGLGPTEDDLTRAAVAGVLNRPLRTDPRLLEALRARFARRGYRMAAINERQAEIIGGAEILENAFGSAPGMWIEENGVYIVLLPGPPRELMPMLETQVLPRVRKMGEGRKLARQILYLTGLTESEVDSKAAPIYSAYPNIQTTILASPGHITLRMSRWIERGGSPSDLEELTGKIREIFGDAVFSTNGESLEEVLGRMLMESGKSLAVAESCTSGMIGMRITRIPGSSRYFLGGVLCYSNEAKRRLCGLSSDMLDQHGAVSAEAAEALAKGVRETLSSSIGLSITGIAGPGGGSEEKPVGLVYVGLSDERRLTHLRRIIPGDRETMRERATYFAMSSLRRFLISDDGNPSSP